MRWVIQRGKNGNMKKVTAYVKSIVLSLIIVTACIFLFNMQSLHSKERHCCILIYTYGCPNVPYIYCICDKHRVYFTKGIVDPVFIYNPEAEVGICEREYQKFYKNAAVIDTSHVMDFDICSRFDTDVETINIKK
jgi:hypothetical protein